MPTRKIVTVNEFAISSLVQQDVGSYANGMGRRIMARATMDAPRRTSELALSHRYAGFLYRGRYKVGTRVENFAGHALFVHEGTTGPILPKTGTHLVVPTSRGAVPLRGITTLRRTMYGQVIPAKAPFVLVRSVRGQRSQPWLRNAGEAVASGSTVGFSFT
jgi:hypothetical protein